MFDALWNNGWVLLAIIATQIYALHEVTRDIFRDVYTFLKRVAKPNIASAIMAIAYWPGTLLHEISHAFAALLVGAKMHKIHFLPEYSDGHIVMGTAEISRLGPIRRVFAGVAPFAVGIAALLGLTYLLDHASSLLLQSLIALALFQVSNNMFLSEADLEYFFPLILFIATAIIAAIVWAMTFGLDVPAQAWQGSFGEESMVFLQTASKYILVVLLLNAAIHAIVRVSTDQD